MQITISIPDSQWEEFQEIAQEAVETKWNGNYEEFATYIMSVNIDSYIKAQKVKQAKKMKKALADYERSLEPEPDLITQICHRGNLNVPPSHPLADEMKQCKKDNWSIALHFR